MELVSVLMISALGLQQVSEESKKWEIFVRGAGAYQFDADLDDDGDYSVFRVGTDVGLDYQFTPELSLGASIGYGFDSYDFSETTSIGADPWEDIHTLTFSARAQWRFAEKWALHLGGLVNMSGEDAEWSDAVTGGGLGAVTYQVNDRLALGVGVGAVSRIEDDAQLFPVIVVDWRITDTLRLTSTTRPTVPSAINRGGLELVVTPEEHWEFAIGGRYDVRRFRLDDEGVAPDGVGEEESLPLWARAGFKINDNVRIDAFAGISVIGELSISDDDGDEIADDEFDPAPFVGGSVSIRF